MEDFDIAPSKIGESAQRIVDRAVEESRRRDHAVLGNEHIFLAFAQVEWDMFAQVMRDWSSTRMRCCSRSKRTSPSCRRSPAATSVSARRQAGVQAGAAPREPRRPAGVEAPDLFSAIFEESQGVPVFIVRRHGVEPELLVSRISTRMRDIELRDERLRKRFELPPFLKHFATNLNLLAQQHRAPPVYGRDLEIQQVLEILCHRERANSVMLIGEPGVGKTAIVEGLARRIDSTRTTAATGAGACSAREPTM